MTALDALKEPKRLERQIFAVMQQIDEEHAKLMPGGLNYEVDRVQTTPRDRFADVMARIDELETQMDELMKRLDKSRERVLLLLDQVKDKDARIILNLHDVIGLPMDAVAEGLYMSRALCYIVRNKALNEIDLAELDDLDTLDSGSEV